jgi:RES domain-containing protein
VLPSGELAAALTEIEPIAVRGPFFRIVAFKYLDAVGRGATNILSGVPGRDRGGRYNPAGGFLTTYVAESAETAVSEGVRPFVGSGVVSALSRPLVLLTVDGHLERVLDLLDPRVRTRVETDEAELVAPYLLDALRGETSTQRLGRMTYESGPSKPCAGRLRSGPEDIRWPCSRNV